MVKKASFLAQLRLKSGAMQRIVRGWQLADGMVLHRTLFEHRAYDDHWSVSDPMTGARIINGWSMGEAVQRYRVFVAARGADWLHDLAVARQNFKREMSA